MIKKYTKYLKGVKLVAIIAPILMMIDTIGTLVQPYYMAKIIDIGIANNDVEYIIHTGVIMIIFAITAMVGGFGCMYFSSKAAYGFGANLRSDLLAKIQEFSFSNINKFSTSSLITRLTNDVEVLSNLVQMMLRIMIRSPLMFLGGLVLSLMINAKLSLIILALIPVLILGIMYFIKKASPFFTKLQTKIDKVNSVIRENIIGVKVIKAFVREDAQKDRFETANEDLRKTAMDSFEILVTMMPLVIIIMNLAIVAALWFGSKLIQINDLDVGQLTAYITYITMTLSQLIMLSMVFMNASRAGVSSKRILEVLETEADIKNEDNRDMNKKVESGLVEFDINSFAFADSKGEAILKNIHFKVEPGETIGIISSTGGGKSTLVNLMPRFYEVNDGSVKIDGIDVREYDLKNLRDGIGMVLQENRLFSGTIKENIMWGKADATDEEIIKACKVAQIHDFISEMPDGYNSRVAERGTNFSGGQKQRMCIARALIKNPKILILDDSVSALDATTERKLTTALREEFKDTTVFIITQRINSCKNVDRIVVLDEGTVESIGTHEELLQNSKVYKEINDSQLEVVSHG